MAIKIDFPKIGFGTADISGDVKEAVLNAIGCGYRLIDTAKVYKNEESVGQAVNEAIERGLVKREEIIIQTKLSHQDGHGYYKTLAGFEESLNKLRLDYIDVYLIHWPVPRYEEKFYREKNIETWQAFSELKAKGLIKHMGVCNFLERHLLHLIDSGYGTPEINQLELHPGYQQIGLVNFCKERGITLEAWSPMGRNIMSNIYIYIYQKSMERASGSWLCAGAYKKDLYHCRGRRIHFTQQKTLTFSISRSWRRTWRKSISLIPIRVIWIIGVIRGSRCIKQSFQNFYEKRAIVSSPYLNRLCIKLINISLKTQEVKYGKVI